MEESEDKFELTAEQQDTARLLERSLGEGPLPTGTSIMQVGGRDSFPSGSHRRWPRMRCAS